MKLFTLSVLVLAAAFMSTAAIASCGSCGSGAKSMEHAVSSPDPMTDASPEESLDDKVGAGTSNKLGAQGTVGYDDNTGMMNVVPSDSRGNIED